MGRCLTAEEQAQAVEVLGIKLSEEQIAAVAAKLGTDDVVDLCEKQIAQELNGFMRAHNTVQAVQVYGA